MHLICILPKTNVSNVFSRNKWKSRKFKCEFMGWRFEAEICNKDTGEKARLRQRSRGHFLCVTGGGHITYFDPIFKWENRLFLIYNQTILKQSSHFFYNEILFVFIFISITIVYIYHSNLRFCSSEKHLFSYNEKYVMIGRNCY